MARLTPTQQKQLDDVVRATLITRGPNAGQRKSVMLIEHFDMRSFRKLILNQFVTCSEYGYEHWYATPKGFEVWRKLKDGAFHG